MLQESALPSLTVWRITPLGWAGVALSFGALLAVFLGALVALVGIWGSQEEYGFGYLVPFIAAFLVWQRKDKLELSRFEGSWTGLGVVAVGLGLGVLGRMSTLDTLAQYAFLLSLLGLILAGCGWRGLRMLAAPLVILCFMVPLPNYLLREVSAQLQLLSSQLGVGMIRLAGTSVFLEGNVIDLGSMKLQVVEACSGLRYLLPLMTLGFIATYFYKVTLWKRVLVFVSTIPITIAMNSLRIALVGITSEYFGKAAAEGFLHDFEGWAVFMLCLAVLFAEMALLARVGRDGRSLSEAFAVDLPAPSPPRAIRRARELPGPFIASSALVLGVALFAYLLPDTRSVTPQRREFQDFPLDLGAWRGRPDRLENIYLDELKLDDYILANYVDGNGHAVNFYVSYYAEQRNGNGAHSPRACLPGDGWEIQSFGQVALASATGDGQPLQVNRVVIQKGEARQLVYYWFRQRGRILTNEYSVKLWIFWDLLTRSRSDGAMVRLVTPLRRGEDLAAADTRLARFASEADSKLAPYVPD
ncbi:MAG: VPLPA-CTERM-specific exosortase XrtD [Candidatus Parcubacteria bacterium]|nr:VPLPA-CTERM-specific exosortase XrtD [Burkholderiales bacterium]